MGQLAILLRARGIWFEAVSFPKVRGKPFKISELKAEILEIS